MTYVIPSWPRPALPVIGGGEFPVRRIYCVGRNYAAHAREMGADPDREPPFFFMKPADALVADGGVVPYPPVTNDLHHEIELVAALGSGGRDILPADALGHVFGYAVGIDLTRRDLQAVARRLGQPWDLAKGFDHSAPCGALRRASEIGHPAGGTIRLAVNGAVRQESDLGQMIWNLQEVIAHLSRSVVLCAGDLIYTGTPEGVGPVRVGDRLDGEVAGVGTLHVTIG